MTECQEFFERLDKECEANGDGSIRGRRLREMGAERLQRLVEWESQIASRFSPGPVGSSEKIRKALFQGRDVVEGSIHRNAFSSLSELGFSADRTDHTSADDSKKRFAYLASITHPLYAYLDIRVADLRAIQCKKDEKDDKSGSTRAIAVYDTAIKENTAHAEAFMIVKFSNTKPRKAIETNLMEKYKGQIARY